MRLGGLKDNEVVTEIRDEGEQHYTSSSYVCFRDNNTSCSLYKSMGLTWLFVDVLAN